MELTKPQSLQMFRRRFRLADIGEVDGQVRKAPRF